MHAAWVADWDRHAPARVHLVKAHQVAEVDFEPDLVLTTKRPPEDCLASLIRMGWLADDPQAIRRAHIWHQKLHAHWHSRSALELSYSQILSEPEIALSRLAVVLGLPASPDRFRIIAEELRHMKAPVKGRYDSTTLLHPRHRRGDGDGPDRSYIRRILESSN